ncbi:hypothetical protein FSP39_022489 [Pinctada imbricata]|uniref:Uncharacterized protein n=1 Tax=Pinctada imbricata TaxID=66713 RepID=A0AA88YME1_PINIB|nr:hypothetical protein FSP39_022489 [Pinctada imbricata]
MNMSDSMERSGDACNGTTTVDNNNSGSTGNNSFVGSILRSASQAIYGTPAGTKSTNSDANMTGPSTSTPKPVGSVNESEILAKLAEQNEKLTTIMQRLSKLDKIDVVEKNVSDMNEMMVRFEGKVTALEERERIKEREMISAKEKIKNLEEKCLSIESRYTKELKRHEIMIEGMSRSMEKMRKQEKEADAKITDLQCRSMKANLIFTGLEGESRNEDTESKLKIFIRRELGITTDVTFGNVHRFGRFVSWQSRPIVARFIFQRDLQLVKSQAYKLKGSQFGIREQYPTDVAERRRILYPVMRDARNDGNRVRLVRDRLYINGRYYDPDMRCDFEDDDVFCDARDTVIGVNDDDDDDEATVSVSMDDEASEGPGPSED